MDNRVVAVVVGIVFNGFLCYDEVEFILRVFIIVVGLVSGHHDF